jgi:biopolymer transport protein ExbB
MNVISDSFHFLMRGGFMMIPLLLSGLFALILIVDRLLFFRKIAGGGPLTRRVLEMAKTHPVAEAKALCVSALSPQASVCLAGLEKIKAGSEELQLALQNQAEEWIPVLERRLEVLDTIITAAPLMGLLGTITGMMASFQVLSEKGVNEPNAITGGVSEALIATATGLVIALLCLAAFNFFTHQVKILVGELERTGSQILELQKELERESQ